MNDERIIESFRSMWGNFPERVRLIRKDRTVLAINKAAEAEGLTTGVRCVELPPKETHAGCQADYALEERRGKYQLSIDKRKLKFWIPVEDCEEVFVHFSLPINRFLSSKPTI